MRRTWLVGATIVGMIGAGSLAEAAPLLLNGSLTGAVANDGVPPSWTILLGSPDTNDITHNVGGGTPFAVLPAGPSPDGGTWVGLGVDSTNQFVESFGQTVGGFNPGTSYVLSWYAGNFGALTGGGYTNASTIEVLLDGGVVGSGALLPLGSLWFPESISFTATAASHQLAFRLQNTPAAYVSIDGIQLNENETTVPEPVTLLLVGTGLGAGAVVRRRRSG